MKWPETLLLIRHGESAYNAFKKEKENNPVYQEFLKSYQNCWDSEETRGLAKRVHDEVSLKINDKETPLTKTGELQAITTGKNLQNILELPDAVFISPYTRTEGTWECMCQGWPGLRQVKIYPEELIIEHDHGLAAYYNDLKVYFTLHPEQRGFYERVGMYGYRYLQGENVPDVRRRSRTWVGTVIREFSEKRVWAITHHLTILSIRCNFERLGETEFVRLDKEEKPINCGVTIYRGDPMQGSDGKLVLSSYNQKLY